jgi:dihydrofolate reductase
VWWENKSENMKISLVAAIGNNFELGARGSLLWHLPADLKRFKELTIGHHVLMGRKTFESIPEKFRPLPNRINVILTSNLTYVAPGCKVVHSLTEAIDSAKSSGESELMVIGGGEVYRLSLPLADILYITWVESDFLEADTFFPKWNPADFIETENLFFTKDAKHAYNYRFLKLERKFRQTSA